MTDDERARATQAVLDVQQDKMAAWLARPLRERQADQDKIEHAFATGGVLAARRMMAALGLPTIPDELCAPPEVLEARAARDAEEAEELGLKDEAAPVTRLDH